MIKTITNENSLCSVGYLFTMLIHHSLDRVDGWVEFAGLENDGVEQEQTYNTAYDEKL